MTAHIDDLDSLVIFRSASVRPIHWSFVRPLSKTVLSRRVRSLWAPCSIRLNSWESPVIKADSLKIFLGVNPTFFAVNADLDPDIRPNAQIDSTL
jgi:hypothetical protein